MSLESMIAAFTGKGSAKRKTTRRKTTRRKKTSTTTRRKKACTTRNSTRVAFQTSSGPVSFKACGARKKARGRKLSPYNRYMSTRIKFYIAKGYDATDAMREAAGDWRKKTGRPKSRAPKRVSATSKQRSRSTRSTKQQRGATKQSNYAKFAGAHMRKLIRQGMAPQDAMRAAAKAWRQRR